MSASLDSAVTCLLAQSPHEIVADRWRLYRIAQLMERERKWLFIEGLLQRLSEFADTDNAGNDTGHRDATELACVLWNILDDAPLSCQARCLLHFSPLLERVVLAVLHSKMTASFSTASPELPGDQCDVSPPTSKVNLSSEEFESIAPDFDGVSPIKNPRLGVLSSSTSRGVSIDDADAVGIKDDIRPSARFRLTGLKRVSGEGMVLAANDGEGMTGGLPSSGPDLRADLRLLLQLLMTSPALAGGVGRLLRLVCCQCEWHPVLTFLCHQLVQELETRVCPRAAASLIGRRVWTVMSAVRLGQYGCAGDLLDGVVLSASHVRWLIVVCGRRCWTQLLDVLEKDRNPRDGGNVHTRLQRLLLFDPAMRALTQT